MLTHYMIFDNAFEYLYVISSDDCHLQDKIQELFDNFFEDEEGYFYANRGDYIASKLQEQGFYVKFCCLEQICYEDAEAEDEENIANLDNWLYRNSENNFLSARDIEELYNDKATKFIG